MGHALADTLLATGTPTTVWNRSADRGTDLIGRGARRAGSAGEAISTPVLNTRPEVAQGKAPLGIDGL
ncbi:hypothetical protein [Streptomyces canus]|uniref:hypothetical protein n=1 Tax=Streptomyces canus TaxID=58343 RepID=UPI0032492B1F